MIFFADRVMKIEYSFAGYGTHCEVLTIRPGSVCSVVSTVGSVGGVTASDSTCIMYMYMYMHVDVGY